MSKQPEALRLADEFDGMTINEFYEALGDEAAAELRRLHEQNQRFYAQHASVVSDYEKAVVALKAQRDALLEVVQKYIAWSEAENDPKGTTFWERVEMCREVDELARAAIKAVEEGK